MTITVSVPTNAGAAISATYGTSLTPSPPDRLMSVTFKSMVIMPGGEPYVEIATDRLSGQPVIVDARIGDMNDFGLLMATLDALRRINIEALYLLIPYFPGARGDRVNDGDGTALAADMYARVINSYHPDRVFIVDPHSDVTPALIKNVSVLTIADVLGAARITPTWDALVCPDQGAEKRTALAAKALGIDRVIYARKTRDRRTGQLTGIEVDFPPDKSWAPENPQLLIVDDICDGGGTFVGLAEALRTPVVYFAGTLTIDLFVTHGIFSKGVDALAGIDRVFCTDSFPRERYAPFDARTPDAVIPVHSLYPLIFDRLPRQ